MESIKVNNFSGSKVNRKTFFKLASLALVVPYYKIWQNAVESKQVVENNARELSIESGIADGVHFFDKVILIKSGDEMRLFSSKCSHLGCRIDKAENSQLVCPCHGSRYNLEGTPVKGPSVNSLTQVKFEIERKPDLITIRFKI